MCSDSDQRDFWSRRNLSREETRGRVSTELRQEKAWLGWTLMALADSREPRTA